MDKPSRTPKPAKSLEKQLEQLKHLGPGELRKRWTDDGGPTPKVDSPILKAVARANQWLTELLSGRSSTLVEIGKREDVGKRYVSRIIRLAFLAPSIIEGIARGHQPPELTAQGSFDPPPRSSSELAGTKRAPRLRVSVELHRR